MSNVRMLTHRGVTRSINEWARVLGVKYTTLRNRLATLPLEQALDERAGRGVHTATLEREAWPGANKVRFYDDPRARLIFDEFAPITRESTALVLGVSRQRVKQLEERALEKLYRLPDTRALRVVLEHLPEPQSLHVLPTQLWAEEEAS